MAISLSSPVLEISLFKLIPFRYLLGARWAVNPSNRRSDNSLMGLYDLHQSKIDEFTYLGKTDDCHFLLFDLSVSHWLPENILLSSWGFRFNVVPPFTSSNWYTSLLFVVTVKLCPSLNIYCVHSTYLVSASFIFTPSLGDSVSNDLCG